MILFKIVMFPDGMSNMPDAFKADGEDDIIAGAKADGIAGGGAVIDRNMAVKDQAFFDFVVFPVELVGLVSPYRPFFTRLDLGGIGLANNDILYSRHS
jgi:hypothetical protein